MTTEAPEKIAPSELSKLRTRPHKRRKWETAPKFATLTFEERLIAGAIAEGYSVTGTAKLFSVDQTVVNYIRRRIYRKMGLNKYRNRSQATLLTNWIVRAELE